MAAAGESRGPGPRELALPWDGDVSKGPAAAGRGWRRGGRGAGQRLPEAVMRSPAGTAWGGGLAFPEAGPEMLGAGTGADPE